MGHQFSAGDGVLRVRGAVIIRISRTRGVRGGDGPSSEGKNPQTPRKYEADYGDNKIEMHHDVSWKRKGTKVSPHSFILIEIAKRPHHDRDA